MWWKIKSGYDLMMKNNNISLTVLIPAFNEAKNLPDAVSGLDRILGKILTDYEMLIIDDGSTDGTGTVAAGLARQYPKIRIISNRVNKGFGISIRAGIQAAEKDYVTQFHGDNDGSPSFLQDFVKYADKDTILSAYPINSADRVWYRKFVSDGFVLVMNGLFRLNLHYYNGAFICRTELLRKTPLLSEGFAIYAEAKVRLARQGYKIREVPNRYVGRKSGGSKAFRLKSVFQTIRTIYGLIRT
jgi:glycosyltransferase involved in cell wall biosynthesis